MNAGASSRPTGSTGRPSTYILHLNEIVPGDFVADRETLPKVKIPDHDNFIWHDERPDTLTQPCMTASLTAADIKSSSTADLNLTPRTTGPLDTMQPT